MKRHVKNVEAASRRFLRPADHARCSERGETLRLRRAFTLVEMLVVITIVGILAGLITAAAVVAVRRAKTANISIELSQLDAACKAYKEKFGEYPPDFSRLQDTTNNPATGNTYQVDVRNAILRHLSKAFPKYTPGISTTAPLTGWDGLRADVLGGLPVNVAGYIGWGVDINNLSPADALAFFLGGKPDWKVAADGVTPIPPTDALFVAGSPVKGLLGLSANPSNPFDSSPSRIRSFYDFDINSLGWLASGNTAGLAYWPRAQAVTDKTKASIVYFRAENGNYTVDGSAPNGNPHTTTNIKSQSLGVWPAIDTRLSTLPPATPNLTWINPQSFQIFASGLDLQYGNLLDVATVTTPFCSLRFPLGTNYATQTFDDITNFSGGTLESKMP